MHATVFERNAPSPALVEESLAASVQRPFWLDDVPARPRYPAHHGQGAADLVIVGGGFLGLWTAILAKEREPGRSVVLLEAVRVGWAASGRNGGFCDASITHGEHNGRRRWPEEYEQLHALGLQNLDEIAAMVQRYRIDCDFERTGTLHVAVEPYQDEWMKGPGYLDREAVQRELASPIYLSGNWDREGAAMLHPGKLGAELGRVATELGVQIFEDTRVTGLQAEGAQVRLSTAQGSLLAGQVVLATNVFPALLKRYRWHTIPVYDHVLMTEPLSAAQLQSIGWQQRQGLSDVANQFHYYRITRDQRILFGGYDAVYHFGRQVREEHEDRPASHRRLASHFFTVFPQLAGLRFSHRWAGAIDTSTRFCAFFGQALQGRVVHCAGFTGLGVGATRFAGNVLLDQLERKDTERTRLRMVREVPIPFPPEPLLYATVQASRWSMNRADHNEGRRNLWLRTLDALKLGFDS